jgi:hypothetical protein
VQYQFAVGIYPVIAQRSVESSSRVVIAVILLRLESYIDNDGRPGVADLVIMELSLENMTFTRLANTVFLEFYMCIMLDGEIFATVGIDRSLNFWNWRRNTWHCVIPKPQPNGLWVNNVTITCPCAAYSC